MNPEDVRSSPELRKNLIGAKVYVGYDMYSTIVGVSDWCIYYKHHLGINYRISLNYLTADDLPTTLNKSTYIESHPHKERVSYEYSQIKGKIVVNTHKGWWGKHARYHYQWCFTVDPTIEPSTNFDMCIPYHIVERFMSTATGCMIGDSLMYVFTSNIKILDIDKMVGFEQTSLDVPIYKGASGRFLGIPVEKASSSFVDRKLKKYYESLKEYDIQPHKPIYHEKEVDTICKAASIKPIKKRLCIPKDII